MGKTGAMILERDGEMTWNEAFTKFECHHDLLPIMGD